MEASDLSSERKKRSVGDGGGVDRISDLPDAVLGDIISFLPTKDGARTQILSPRWRHLWRSAPLNLDCSNLARWAALAGVVSQILSSHQGPGRCFRTLGGCGCYGAATVDSWLQSAAVDNLQEVCLFYPVANHLPLPLPLPPLSASFLRFSTTLRVATIGQCHLPSSTLQGLQFPQLKQLTLEMVSISECSLHHMIAGCAALDCLLIDRSFCFRCFRINSVSLRSIGVRTDCHWEDEIMLGELVIEDAPSLEKLLHLDRTSDLHVSVLPAPKLETLRCLSAPSTKISFGSPAIQGLHIDSLTTVVCSIKILAVVIDILSLDTIVDLMRCFPCLEKLCIQSFKSGRNNLWLRKHKNLIKCHDIRLKKIMFGNYWGIKSQVSFVTFFVLNARLLESMTLRIRNRENHEEFLAEQRKKLRLENRLSRDAQFHFTTGKCLDLTDPFAR